MSPLFADLTQSSDELNFATMRLPRLFAIFVGNDAAMLNSFQKLSVLAAAFLVARVAGAGASPSSAEVVITVKNKFGIAVVVTIGNKDTLVREGATPKAETKAKPGTSIHWKAAPAHEWEQDQFLSCEGNATVSDKGEITVEKNSACVKRDASKTLKPKDVEKLIVSVEHIISVENKSMYEVEFFVWDKQNDKAMEHKFPVNGTWSFPATVRNGRINLSLSTLCATNRPKPSFVYTKQLESLQIYDEKPKTDDEKRDPSRLNCRLTPKGDL